MGTNILMSASDFQGRGRKHLKQVLGYRPIFSDDALDLKPDQQFLLYHIDNSLFINLFLVIKIITEIKNEKTTEISYRLYSVASIFSGKIQC